MALSKLPVLGRSTNFDNGRANAPTVWRTVRVGILWTFFSHLSFLTFFSFLLGNRPI